MSQGMVCHNCGKGHRDPNRAEAMWDLVQLVKVSLTGYYQERTEWERSTFCSMTCLHSYFFGEPCTCEEGA